MRHNTQESKYKKKISRFFRYVLIIFISIVLGLSIYIWNAGSLVGNKLPMPFGIGAAVVLSGSMEPSISVDDMVLVREGGSYQVGDVIVYEADGMMITHRIYSKEDDTIVTWGDANPVADNPISIQQVKGTVVAVIPKIGVLVRFIKQPIVIILLVAIAFLLFELSYRKEKRIDNEEIDSVKEQIRKLKNELNQEDN
ncbi:MAG: signal peptidase I [Eubacterium sp.]|nr:signal peptidase I [Eubacterium sp.]MDE6767769.1 signal peptidase I [Eubacterium sp.]